MISRLCIFYAVRLKKRRLFWRRLFYCCPPAAIRHSRRRSFLSLLLEKQEQEQRQEQKERQGENVILLTHSATAFSTTQKIAGRFKMALEEKSGGRFRVEIFPDDTLGHVNDSDRPLLNQTVEMRIGPAATDTMGAMLWASTLSDASLEEIDKLLKDGEARRMLEEECEAKGIKLLAVFPAHYRVLTGNERIDEAEDFSKLEMRILDFQYDRRGLLAESRSADQSL